MKLRTGIAEGAGGWAVVKGRFKYGIVLLVVVGLIFAVVRFVNLASTLDKFDEFAWVNLWQVLVLSLIYYLLKAIRWHYLLSILNIHIPARRSILLYMAGQWFAVTPAGEFVRAYLLAGYGFAFSRGSAVVTVQVLLDFLSLAVVGSISVLWYRELALLVLPFTGALTMGIILVSCAPRLIRASKLPFLRDHQLKMGSRWADFYQHSQQLLGWKPLIVGLGLGLVTVMVGAGVLFEVCQGYQIPSDLTQSSHIYAVSQLVGSLSMLPHGLGAMEGSAVALFHYAGIDTPYAATAVVLFRLVTLGWSIILGGISLLLLRTPLAGPSILKPA